MQSDKPLAKKTLKNYFTDVLLFISAISASLSGVYFLYFVSNGYQGGRNPLHDVVFLFTRQTWDLIHTWTGVAMIAIVAVHLPLHWKWVESMTKRMVTSLVNPNINPRMNNKARFNIALDGLIAVSFLLTAATGIYFLIYPVNVHAANLIILFSRTTWDLIHTWSGIIMVIAAILHFAIHWMWVVKVTKKLTAQIFKAAKQKSGHLEEAAPLLKYN
jgi:hypothetical protein